jgi:NitT/TauT family transport system permease protein
MLQTPSFWVDLWASWTRVFLGFFLSFAIAFPVTIASLIKPKVKEIVFYFVEFFRYLPIPVFIPITIFWFGVGDGGKIAIVFLGTFAQMIPMFYDSAKILDDKFDAFKVGLKWPRARYVSKIVVPGSMPYILDNARLCLGWAWTYLIVAELLGAEHGIGFAIIRAQRYLDTDKIFAYIIAIGLLGIVMDRAMLFAKRKLYKWI